MKRLVILALLLGPGGAWSGFAQSNPEQDGNDHPALSYADSFPRPRLMDGIGTSWLPIMAPSKGLD